MKILMFAPLFYPHIGGVEKHIAMLSKELVKKGNDVLIITIKHDPKLADFEEINKIKVHRIKFTKLKEIWSWIYKNIDLIKNADVIHCHDFGTFILWYLPFRFLVWSKPVFVTFHGHEGIVPIPKKVLFKRKITELLTKGNICVGHYIPKWYGTKANFILYGGVEEPAYQLSSDIKLNSTNSGVFIGRLEKDTDIMTYVNAVKILKENYDLDFKMDICGDGSLVDKIKQIISESNLNIKLHGFVKEPIKYLITNKIAFVSGYLAILEAMINRKLVFAVYSNELKKDYLTLIPNSTKMMIIVSSAEELAEKIVYYQKNTVSADKMIDEAYNFAKPQTWENVVNTYLRLWQDH